MLHFPRTLCALLCASLLWAHAAPAGAAAPEPATTTAATASDTLGPGVLAHALDAQGRAFDAQGLRGKVTIVFVWSTACSVCRTALPELRANAAGWRSKPFALVTLNVDAQRSDWLTYEQVVARVSPAAANLHALWQNARPATARLPLTLVLDAQGRVVARHEGRMAPQAWDAVADLLP